MRWNAIGAGLLVWALTMGAGGSAGRAMGDSLPGAALPEGTRWVIHVDVDSGRLTPLWEMARMRLVEPRRAEIGPRVAMVERITGLTLPEGLHDVTLFGAAYDETAVCIRIHAEMDEERTTSFLKMDPEFRSEEYKGHTVVTWRDKEKDRLMFGTFAAKGLVMLSPSMKVLQGALDTLDGRMPAIKAGSPLLPGGGDAAGTRGGGGDVTAPGKQPVLWVAGDMLSELQRAQKTESPALTQMDAASLSVRWADDKAVTQVRVAAKTDKAALQMQAIAEGVKATVALAASDEHAPPRAKVFAAAMQEFTITTDKALVKGEWTLGIDKIESLMEIMKQDMPAGRGPGNNPGAGATQADKK